MSTEQEIRITAGNKLLIIPWTERGIKVALMFIDLLKDELAKREGKEP